MANHVPASVPKPNSFGTKRAPFIKSYACKTDGVTHNESLIQPKPAGNCLNWVVGHLIAVYNNALPVLEQEPVTSKGSACAIPRVRFP